MRTALQYAVNPIDDIKEIVAFLDGFGGWMIKEADYYLKNSERNET